jgi:DNA modification methylase
MDQIELLSLPLTEQESPSLSLDRTKLVRTIDSLMACEEAARIRTDVQGMMANILESPKNNTWACPEGPQNGRLYRVDQEVFVGNLRQIMESRTIERVKYYLQRLKISVTRVKTGKINDINLNRWKEYKDIRTDSLWMDKKRDKSGVHMASYWGNFIPQIPAQMMVRFTKAGEHVMDTFAGSGTTLIECRRLGRNGIGLELNPTVARNAQFIVESQENPFSVKTEIVNANSVNADYRKILADRGIEQVQLVMMHPPYHDIIRFSDNEDDLSNAASVEDFLDRLQEIGRRVYDVLERGRFACLVIGDKYHKGEWIPLGFWSMQRLMEVGFHLKSIVIKNFDQTKGKRSQEELWRYRALVGGYFVFKHEYIFLLQRD